MRKATLDLLRCPRCLAGSLTPEEAVAEPAVIFGPVRCLGCGARFPVHEGLIDLVGEGAPGSPFQRAMEVPWVARAWERSLRPVVDVVLTLGRIDLESEYTVARALLGAPAGPVVDLGCGTGLYLRRLARDFPAQGVIGVDLSRPMLEEAMAQVHEHAVAADLLRALVPPLPFGDHTVGGIAAAGLVHFVADLDALLLDAARVLKPGGRFVASTFDAPEAARGLHRTVGLHPRGEAALREAVARAGLVRFERVKTGPLLLWKAEQP